MNSNNIINLLFSIQFLNNTVHMINKRSAVYANLLTIYSENALLYAPHASY